MIFNQNKIKYFAILNIALLILGLFFLGNFEHLRGRYFYGIYFYGIIKITGWGCLILTSIFSFTNTLLIFFNKYFFKISLTWLIVALTPLLLAIFTSAIITYIILFK